MDKVAEHVLPIGANRPAEETDPAINVQQPEDRPAPEAQAESSASAFAQRVSTGLRLARARIEQGLTIEDVSNHTKLPAKVVESIENSDFTGMHGVAYATGYVRAYAKMLDLDADAIIQDDPELGLDSSSKPVEPYQVEPISPIRYPYGKLRSLLKWALILAVAAGAAYLWSERAQLAEFWKDYRTPAGQAEPASPPTQPGETQSTSDTINSFRLS